MNPRAKTDRKFPRGFSLLFLLLVALIPGRLVAEYRFHTAAGQAIYDDVQQSLLSQTSHGPLRITPVVSAFHSLDRRGADRGLVEDLLTLKYMLPDWRERTSDYLIERALSSGPGEFKGLIRELAEVGVLIERDAILKLGAHYERMPRRWREDPELQTIFFHFLAHFGEPPFNKNLLADLLFRAAPHSETGRRALKRALVAAGPGEFFGVQPIHGRPFRLDSLLQANLDAYEFIDDETVYYRGITWRSGRTLVLLDLNVSYDGINTCFSDPRSCFTHNGHFVVLKFGGRKIPGIFEIYETGLRFVPLENYVARHFMAYGEVYELAEAPPDLGPRVERQIRFRLTRENQLGYGFAARPVPESGELPEGDTWAVCSELPPMTFGAAAGIVIRDTVDKIDDGAMKNLDRLGGLPPGQYYTPTSILRSRKLSFVGTVDNREFVANAMRELVIGATAVPRSMGDLLSHYDLDFRALERRMPFRALRWAAETVQNKIAAGKNSSLRHPVGALLEKALGYQDRTFPQASASSLALAVYLQRFALEPGVNRLKRTCPGLLETEGQAFILQEVEVSQRDAIWEELNRRGVPPLFTERK